MLAPKTVNKPMKPRILLRIPTIVGLALTAVHGPAQSTYEPYTFSTLAGNAGSGGNVDATASVTQFYSPWGVALDSADNVYVADTLNSTIRKVTPTGVVTILAGTVGKSDYVDGTGSAARFLDPRTVAVDSSEP